MGNEENLIPFENGDKWKGNKAGRPKGSVGLTTRLKKYLSAKIDFKDPIDNKMKRGQVADMVILKLLNNAIKKGDMKAIQEILDRVEGKPLQKQEIVQDFKKIEVEIVHSVAEDKRDSGSSKEPGS